MTGAHQPIVVSEGMADHLKSSFAIIRSTPVRTSRAALWLSWTPTLRQNTLWGTTNSASAKRIRYNGWRYFLEETDLAPGMNADEATKLRQVRLERRESGAL